MTGIEELRRMAGDIEPEEDPVLYDILREGTEEGHGAGPDSTRTLSRALMDIVAQMEGEAHTDRERRVLDMWPRWEDTGEPVLLYEEAVADSGQKRGERFEVRCVMLKPNGATLRDKSCGHYANTRLGGTIKRPEVLATDGKPLHEGEHVWDEHGDELVVVGLSNGLVRCRYSGEPNIDTVDNDMWEPSQLTHEPPDSWDKWGEDIRVPAWKYFQDIIGSTNDASDEFKERAKAADLERRAKSLCERGQ